MEKINIKSYFWLVILCLGLGGCISIPASTTPRFYMLSAINENQVSKKIIIAPDVIIGIGPVKIPEFLDRPQMVTRTKEGMIRFAQFDRWGESLDLGVTR